MRRLSFWSHSVFRDIVVVLLHWIALAAVGWGALFYNEMTILWVGLPLVCLFFFKILYRPRRHHDSAS